MTFELSKAGMSDAAKMIRTRIGDFQEQAADTLKAAQTLGDSWQGDAFNKFESSVQEFKSWADEMVTVVEEYAAALEKGLEEYANADTTAAGYFKK